MSTKSLLRDVMALRDVTADQHTRDEWDIFPPDSSAARPSIATPTRDERYVPASDKKEAGAAQCRFCTETIPPGALECPLCLRQVKKPVAETLKTSEPAATSSSRPSTAMSLAGAYLASTDYADLLTAPIAEIAPASASPDAGAVYTLESPVQCAECDAEISTIQVIRVLRTQAAFSSTLPRKAYVIACPACRRLLSAGLSGLF